MIRDLSSTRHTINQEYNIVCQYLRLIAATRSPSELIQEFQNLLQQGKNEDQQVSSALQKVILAPKAQFFLFINHCFYSILDDWSEKPESMVFIEQLRGIINEIGSTKSYDRKRKKLIKLIRDYQETEFYLQLKIVMAIIKPQILDNSGSNETVITDEMSNSRYNYSDIIGDYLVRYTYLYQYLSPSDSQFNCLLSLIEDLKNKRQKSFEISLSQHIIYRIRLKQFAQMKLLAKGAGKAITKVDNPSFLSERAFRIALKQYTGKIGDYNTIQEQAQHFIAKNKLRRNYKEFKHDLYCFLISGIRPRNNTYKFKDKLKQKLSATFTQSDIKSINRPLITQTCKQLFSFLLIDSKVSKNTQKLANLISNLGTAQVMMILMKILLICPESKPDLEKKFFLVVAHYQSQTVQDNLWLIKSLEHLLMAFSIYFGKVDVSLAKSALNK
ncbi:MAG: hypothetical protein AAGE84_24860 [Cyanobacteria bacterium P01_G01_bin.39]